MSIDREAIYAALFAALQNVTGAVTVSRRLAHWADVPAEAQPAIYQAQARERAETVTGQPTRWTLSLDVYVYVRTDGGAAPGPVLNPILDAIEAIFVPHPIEGRHTFSGAPSSVHWARIEGEIETSEGTLGDQEVAIVPIKILAA